MLEVFQWLTDAQSGAITEDERQLRKVEEEMADVALYLLRLADVLGLDLQKAVDRKLRINAEKYPVKKARGNAKKYTDL